MGSGRYSNSFKLSWLSLLPVRMNNIQSKMKAFKCSQYSPIISLWRFFQTSRIANSADPGPILLNSKPMQAFIAVIVTCKNKADPMKNGRDKVLTRFSPL